MKLNATRLTTGCLALCWLTMVLSTAQAQIEWDKPENTKPLPSPYTIAASRPQIISTARQILNSCGISYQDQSRRIEPIEDKLLTGWMKYADGVTSRTDLAHYANLPRAEETRAWVEGRVRIAIRALPLDEHRSQIVIEAFPQGRAAPIVGPDRSARWIDLESNGRLEDEVLRGLAGKILGLDLSIDHNGRRRILKCEY
ncbi:MAG: hypothetical protein U0Z53_07265 [Blastocatellia bacterium]